MPVDYYTNMLSLRSDILIVTKLLTIKDKRLMDHFEDIRMDISLLMVESFLTLFTNTCDKGISDVIIDHFVVEGSTTLIKAMILIVGYMRVKLMAVDSFAAAVKYCRHAIKQADLVDPRDFSRDLMAMNLDSQLIDEVRDVLTAKERAAFRTSQNQTRIQCEQDWPICYKSLDKIKASINIERQSVFRSKFILSNYKLDHFGKNTENRGSSRTISQERPDSRVDASDECLIIERQGHICECSNTEIEEMKTEVRDFIRFKVLDGESYKTAQVEYQSPRSTNLSYHVRDIIKRHNANSIYQTSEDDGSQSGASEDSLKSIKFSYSKIDDIEDLSGYLHRAGKTLHR
jgi:Rab-GTPase-TBC domain